MNMFRLVMIGLVLFSVGKVGFGVQEPVPSKETEQGADAPTVILGKALSERELENLFGLAGTLKHDEFKARVFNGHRNIVITELTVEVQTNNSDGSVQSYAQSLAIAPLGRATVRFPVPSLAKGELTWKIVAAKGVKQG